MLNTIILWSMLAYFLYITISFLREFRTLSSPLISSTPNLLSPEFNSCLPISSLVFPCLHFSIFLISSNLKCSVLFCSVLFCSPFSMFCSVLLCSVLLFLCPVLVSFFCVMFYCVLFCSIHSSLSLSLSLSLLTSFCLLLSLLYFSHLLTCWLQYISAWKSAALEGRLYRANTLICSGRMLFTAANHSSSALGPPLNFFPYNHFQTMHRLGQSIERSSME